MQKEPDEEEKADKACDIAEAAEECQGMRIRVVPCPATKRMCTWVAAVQRGHLTCCALFVVLIIDLLLKLLELL